MGFFNFGRGSLLGMRRMVGIHQGRERSDVLLTIVLPAVLMLISAYTNAWAFTGGHLSLAPALLANTIEGLVRGVIVEGIVFSCFMAVRVLCSQGWRMGLLAIVPAALGLVAVAVSAGCGLAWVAKSGQLDWMIGVVSVYLPSFVERVFQIGLGLLFPVALAVFALYDARFLIHEHVRRGAQLGSLAVAVESAEHHQNMLRRVQQEEDAKMESYYRQIAQANAQRAVQSARQGDLSFGLDAALSKTQQLPVRSSVVPVSTAQPSSLPVAPQGPVPIQQPSIPAQFGPAPYPPTGMTQPVQVPPPPMFNGSGGVPQR